MLTLNDLTPELKAHWELHLNALMKDTPTLKKDVRVLLRGGILPNIKHPSYIHDWMEQPEMRLEVEAWNG